MSEKKGVLAAPTVEEVVTTEKFQWSFLYNSNIGNSKKGG